MKTNYACDICDTVSHDENGSHKGYYGYTSTHGYCDNPQCKKIAYEKTGAMIREEAGAGNFDLAEELAGDEDMFAFI
jgi:hypothetical protein